MKLERWLLVLAVVAASALMAEALWRGPFFPSNDGPHHVYGAFARAHIDDAALNYAAYVVPNGPTSANGFADLFAALEGSLGWRDAERATLAITCILFLVGCVALARHLHPARAWLGFVAGSGALGWALFMGFYEFMLASGLSFFVVLFALRMSTLGQRVGFGFLLLFLASIHFVVAVLVGGLVLLARVASAQRRVREALWVLLSGAPAAALTLRVSGAEGHGDATEVLPLPLRLAAAGACTVGGPAWKQGAFVGLALLGLGTAAALWRTRSPTERVFAGVALAGFLVPVFAPWSFLGWQHAAVRALPLCAAVAVALVPIEELRGRAYPVAAAACVAFFAVCTLSARDTLVRAAADLADVEAALETKVHAGYRLSVVTTSPAWVDEAGLFRWDPLRGIGSVFGVVHGGLPAYAHTVSPQAHTVLVRPDLAPNLPAPPLRSTHQSRIRRIEDDAARAAALAPVVERARAFESVLAFERPADHAVWTRAGFRVVAEHGRVLLLAVDVTPP